MQVVLNNIRKRREELNFSQEYMAAKLNISQAAYSKIESGKTEFTFADAITICRILGTNLNEVMEENPSYGKKEKDVEERLAFLEKAVEQIKKWFSSNKTG